MAAGRVIGCFGLTEAHGGSDPAAMKTRAVRDGGDWVINGSKMWITSGPVADIAIVWAHTEDGIQGFVLEKGMAGFTTQEIKHKMSLRASLTGALFFDNVRVPERNRLPNVQGLKGPLGCLNQARYGISWGPIGAAVACLDEALNYTKERVLFGRPVAATQSAQIKLADMARRITTAQLLSLQLGRLKDAGQLQPQQVSLAKWNNCRMAIDIARECRDLLGGAGITTEHVAIRHALNLESVITYEGTETVHQLVIGRELSGINAFYAPPAYPLWSHASYITTATVLDRLRLRLSGCMGRRRRRPCGNASSTSCGRPRVSGPNRNASPSSNCWVS
jgi:glutaryl-CoA dehydrogenase